MAAQRRQKVNDFFERKASETSLPVTGGQPDQLIAQEAAPEQREGFHVKGELASELFEIREIDRDEQHSIARGEGCDQSVE
jgi:hypothetical protein